MGSYTSGNDTYACDSFTCSLSCASPEFGTGVCYGLQQNFLDGTDCGGGGSCQNVSFPLTAFPLTHMLTCPQGQCKGSNVGGEIKSWIDDHKPLVIGICAAVGGLILLAILSCLYRCFRRRRARSAFARNKVQSSGSWVGGPPPPVTMAGGAARGSGGLPFPTYAQSRASVMSGGNGAGWNPQPPPGVPPSYQRSTGSVRYA
jgi:hypothetical protein